LQPKVCGAARWHPCKCRFCGCRCRRDPSDGDNLPSDDFHCWICFRTIVSLHNKCSGVLHTRFLRPPSAPNSALALLYLVHRLAVVACIIDGFVERAWDGARVLVTDTFTTSSLPVSTRLGYSVHLVAKFIIEHGVLACDHDRHLQLARMCTTSQALFWIQY
jgi:hypothetical protein